jgi:hypothetical protein
MILNIVYKQRVHNGHTKTVYMTSTVGEFTEKICHTKDKIINHH